MTDSNLIARLRDSDGWERFTASDGMPGLRLDETLMAEAADRIGELEYDNALLRSTLDTISAMIDKSFGSSAFPGDLERVRSDYAWKADYE